MMEQITNLTAVQLYGTLLILIGAGVWLLVWCYLYNRYYRPPLPSGLFLLSSLISFFLIWGSRAAVVFGTVLLLIEWYNKS